MKCSKYRFRDAVCRIVLSTYPNVIWVVCESCKNIIMADSDKNESGGVKKCQRIERLNG